MLQLTRARNRLTTPATLTLPEIAASGLTVSASGPPQLQERREGHRGARASCRPQIVDRVLCAVFLDWVFGFHSESPKYISPHPSNRVTGVQAQWCSKLPGAPGKNQKAPVHGLGTGIPPIVVGGAGVGRATEET